MNTPNEVQALSEEELADIKLGEALARLEKNKDFKSVIREMFLDGGAINLTKNVNMVKNQEQVIEQIKARGYLYRFLMEVKSNADGANQALREMQEEQVEEL